jgi:hypothetical protein
MMNERQGRKLLEPWMTAAEATGEPALRSFVTGLRACSRDRCTAAPAPPVPGRVTESVPEPVFRRRRHFSAPIPEKACNTICPRDTTRAGRAAQRAVRMDSQHLRRHAVRNPQRPATRPTPRGPYQAPGAKEAESCLRSHRRRHGPGASGSRASRPARSGRPGRSSPPAQPAPSPRPPGAPTANRRQQRR